MAQRPSLIPLIIDMGIAPAEMLQEVHARQVIYGGSEELNLVEVGMLEEGQLIEALARASSLPLASPGPLLVDQALTLRLVAAECDAVAGLGADGKIVASVQRTEPEHLADLRRILGDDVHVVRASALRVEEARAACTERPLDPRVARVLDRWGQQLLLPESSTASLGNDALTQAANLPRVEETSSPRSVTPPEEMALPPSVEVEALRPLPTPFERGSEEAKKGMRPMSNKAMPLEGGGPPSSFSVGETAPPPEGYEDVTARSAAKSTRQPTLAIQYDLAQAQKDLRSARSRDRIIEVFVTLAATHFDYVAAFGLHKSEARGLAALGDGADSETVKRLSVPLDLPSAFSKVQRSGTPEVLRLRAAGMEGGVTRDLARAPGLEVLLHPITLRGRALLLLWCDQTTASPPDAGRKALQEITPEVVEALTRVLLERKRASLLAQPAHLQRGSDPSPPGPTLEPPTFTEPPPPDDGQNDDVPPGVAGEESGATFEAKSPALDPEEDITRKRTSPRRAPEGDEENAAIGTERNPAAPPAALLRDAATEQADKAEQAEQAEQAETGGHEVAPARKRTLTRPQGPESSPSDPPQSFPSEATRTLPGFPPAPSPAPSAISEPREAPAPDLPAPPSSAHSAPRRPPLLSRRIVPLGKGRGEPRGRKESASTPARPSKGEDDSDDPEAEPRGRTGLEHIDAERYLEQRGAPEFEAPHSTNFAAHASGARRVPLEAPPPDVESFAGSSHDTLLSRRAPVLEPDPDDWDNPAVVSRRPALPSSSSQEAALRSRSWSDLVAELLGGDESAIERLVNGGETAVGALIAEFPGPVTEPQGPHDAASSCGPVLRALARIGAKATPFITVRTADEDAEVRRWATLLLGELPGRESARAIASRLLDTSVEVRRAALASARRVRNDTLTRRMLRAQIEAMTRDAKLAVQERSSAIEALADIREHEAVPSLLMLLESPEPALRRAARWALCVLTRQDFGTEIRPWQAFWQEHRDEDRVEWLISSLDHENRDIRRAAGEELRTLSDQDFGFDEDQGQAARRQAQAAFRSWWTETGKAALSRQSPGSSEESRE